MQILQLEDDLRDVELIQACLEAEGLDVTFVVVRTGEQFCSALAAGGSDLILCDYGIPGYDGKRALADARLLRPDTPFIFVSGSIGEERAVDALRSGATDYVLKTHLAKLPIAVTRALREIQDREQARRIQMSRAAEHAITRLLAEDRGLDESAAAMLEAIGRCFGWETGAFWVVDEAAAVLRHRSFWQCAGLELDEFAAVTRSLTLARGEGLPGNVWQGGQPIWRSDLPVIDGSPRTAAASTAGLHTAVGVPFPRGEAIGGVIEFFSRRVLEPEPEMLKMMSAVGMQVGQYLKALEVQEAHGRLAGVIGATPDLVAMATPELELLYLNPAGRRLLSIPADEPPARIMAHTLWSAAELARLRLEILPAVGRESVWAGESALVERSGGEVPVSLVAIGHRCTDGSLEHVSLVARDMRRQRQLEAELRQSQKMEAFGQLAGGIAHDFNNLLTVISGYCALALGDPERGDTLQEPLSQIRDAAVRAAALTRQLLAFSRRQVLQPVVLDLNALITDTGKMLRMLIGEDVELVTQLAPDLGRVKADPGQIAQVLLNLTVNARDAMPTGGRITISTENILVDERHLERHPAGHVGPHVAASVSDTGRGIDPAILSRLFEPFFTTKEVGRGTGLGLSTALGIVQQSGGHMGVETRAGIGATFRMYLPRVDLPVSEVGPEELHSPPEARGQTLLLVEDEAAVRELTQRLLVREGYTILSAGSGGEALALARGHGGPIHLLVTDVVMPDRSGPDLATALQDLCPGLRVLFMSGYTDDALVRHGAREGVIALLQKPFAPATLLRKVRDVLNRPAGPAKGEPGTA